MQTSIFILLALLLCPDCRNLPNGIDCGNDGRCWVQHPDWEAEAQAHDAEGTKDGVDAGVLAPAPAPIPSPLVECWAYGEAGNMAHVCKLETECYDLHAKPVDELDFAGPCGGEYFGAWDYTLATATACYGVFDGLELAVRLRP